MAVDQADKLVAGAGTASMRADTLFADVASVLALHGFLTLPFLTLKTCCTAILHCEVPHPQKQISVPPRISCSTALY